MQIHSLQSCARLKITATKLTSNLLVKLSLMPQPELKTNMAQCSPMHNNQVASTSIQFTVMLTMLPVVTHKIMQSVNYNARIRTIKMSCPEWTSFRKTTSILKAAVPTNVVPTNVFITVDDSDSKLVTK